MFARLHNQSPLLSIMVCLSVPVLLSACLSVLSIYQSDSLSVCLSVSVLPAVCAYVCVVFPSEFASVLPSVCPPVCLCVCASVYLVCLSVQMCQSSHLYISHTLHIFHSEIYFSKFVLTGEICSNFMSWSCKHLLWYQGCSGFWVFGLQDYWSFRGVTQYVRIFVVVAANLCIQFFQQYSAMLR